MGLWIRTQDKKCLVELKEAWIIERQDRNFAINLKANTLNWYEGGVYSTKEKAIKVLDMMQQKIIEIDKTRFYGVKRTSYLECFFKCHGTRRFKKMIDEKKLIEELETLKAKTIIFKSDLIFNDAINTVINKANEQPKVNEWIPVEKGVY